MQSSEWADDSDVATHRARARDLLNEIAQQVKQGLADAGIDLDLFFIIPSSGESILTFGTMADPSDDQWNCVTEIVADIVRATVGLRRTRTRPVVCASTDAVASGPVEMPVPTPGPLPILVEGDTR